MMRTIVITMVSWLLLISLVASCDAGNKKVVPQPKVSAKCSDDQFVRSDSAGVITGKLAKWSEKHIAMSSRGLWLIDADGDTALFRVEPDETDNLNETKLVIGHCVKVTYKTEVVEEDGIELNRFFHVTRLDYPQ
jgi:hypothetical protein